MSDPIPRPVDRLAVEEATITSAARGAQADRDRMALQAAREPGNKAVVDDLVALEAELDGYRLSIERIAAARRALAAAAAADNLQARQARLDAHRTAALAAAADRAKAAAKVEKALLDLGAALTAEASAGQAAWAAANEAARLLPDTIRRTAATGVQAAALGNPAPMLGLLNTVLADARQAGSALTRFVEIGAGVHCAQPSISSAAQADAAHLAQALSTWSVDVPVDGTVEVADHV
jgi:hypothetical protein